MTRHLTALVLLLAPALARAQPVPAPAPEPVPVPVPETTPEPAPEPAPAPAPAPAPEPPDPDVSALLENPEDTEIIRVWDERKTKPFDRDTELRITGEELRRRGVRDLAEALEFIPEVTIRDVNRGGRQIEIRGARKSSVKVFVDGIPLSDPYRGNFDVSTIPVTDIVEVRVSASPASPIDGTGGPGGVVEVHTRDAIGGTMVVARTDVNSLPQALAAASARTMLGEHLALRISATGDVGSRDLEAVVPPGTAIELNEGRRAAAGALRLEYRKNTRRLAFDVGGQAGTYLVPPSETETGQVIVIDRSLEARLGLTAEDEFGKWRLQARGYGFATSKRTLFHPDATLDTTSATEKVVATSLGGRFLANRLITEGLEVIGSTHIDSDEGTVETETGGEVGGRATLIAAAAGVKFERGKFRTDAAAGVAMPLGLGSEPWPEGKVALKLSPVELVALRLVGGYKGRLPTLRERFETGNGNAELGPEKALYAEFGVKLEKNDYVELDVAPYVRRLNGFIRFNAAAGELTNVGEITMKGIDTRAILLPQSPVRVGGSLCLIDVNSAFGDDAIERLPERRADAWIEGRWGSRVGGLARWRYVGPMPDQGMTLPSYQLFDVTAYGRLGGDFTANVGVDNLFDDRYLDRSSGVFGVGRVFRLGIQGTWE